MHVSRFIPVTGIEKETIWPFPEYGRHSFAPEPRPLLQQDLLLQWTTNYLSELHAGLYKIQEGKSTIACDSMLLEDYSM